MAFARVSSIKVKIYRDMKVKTCFSTPLLTPHTPNNLHSTRTMKFNQNIPNHRTAWTLDNFHVLEMYFTNQISFCQLIVDE